MSFAGLEFARCYTIGRGIVTPAGATTEIISGGHVCSGY